MFQLGDLARFAEAKWPDTWHQVFPEWVSPGMIARAAGVARAYPQEAEREIECTYSQYTQNASKPDRQDRLAAIVDKGLTTDESRKADQEERAKGGRAWLLAIDIHYFTHRHYHSGAGVETAARVASWVQRTVERLKTKGATDVLCTFEGRGSFRREATKEWETPYKSKRGPKEPDLVHQLGLVRSLLEGHGFCCVSHDDHEADDCLSSAANQFPGRVTIVSADKDMKQCLSDRVNLLRDVTWTEDDTSGELMPEYHWYTAKNLMDDTGLRPDQFADLQTIQGDPVDSVAGAPGIGEKGALNLMQVFGSVDACIEAARTDDERLADMPRGKTMRAGLLELTETLDVTRKLVTLRSDLPLPTTTRV